MDEQSLVEKLRRIEALYAGAKTDGESTAAANAIERIRRLINEASQKDPPIEYAFSTNNLWATQLLVGLLRRYGIRPYRNRRQRYTTVMARVSKRFVDHTLWPEYLELEKELRAHLDAVAQRIIANAINPDSFDAEEQPDPAELAMS